MRPLQIQDRVTFGFWLYLMSDAVLFAALFAAYAVLGGDTWGGEAPRELFSLSFVLIETLLLLTSSATAGLALFAARLHKKYAALVMLAATFALGASFVGMELAEFSELIFDGNAPGRSAFLSSFFTLVGTHGVHVTFGLVWLAVLAILIRLRGLTHETIRKLACWGLFWHFLDVIWIFIFTFVYLFGFI